MGKPAPKPPTVDYLFCRNPQCSFHATFLLKDRPKDLGPDSPCPQSPPDTLEMIELQTSSPIPVGGLGPPTGVVLPVPPYGGFRLMFDDRDETQTWEQAQRSEARHAGARYVAELQRDLLRLGFYSHGRAQHADENGKITINVVAAILDLKRHLVDFYGIPFSEDLAAVTATAGSGAGPVYYKRLTNPAQVYHRFEAWKSVLDGAKSVSVQVRGWGAQWEKVNRAGKDAAGLLPALILLSAIARKLRSEIDAATAVARELTSRPPQAFAFPIEPSKRSLANDRSQTIRQCDIWLSEDSKTPARGGAFQALTAAMDDLEARWATPPKSPAHDVPRPDGWDDLRAALHEARDALRSFVDVIKASEATTFFENYRQELRQFAIVDGATARYVRQMILTGQLGGRGVFLLPFDAEVENVPSNVDTSELIAVAVDRANVETKIESGKSVRRDRRNTPLPILNFIFFHESGKSHVMSFGSRQYATIGIDYANGSGVDASNFDEFLTSPKTWSSSRGWGMTQFTTAGEGMRKTDAITTGIQDYQMNAGIPYGPPGSPGRPLPLFIQKATENIFEGVKLYVEQKFAATMKKRDCTFKDPYDCANCLRNFELVPSTDVDAKTGAKSLKRSASSIVFDEPTHDFTRVRNSTGSLVSFALSDVSKLRRLLKAGLYKLDGVDPSGDLDVSVTSDACVEFPCSWVDSVLRYCGAGNQAYWYAQEAMWTIAGKPNSPEPVKVK